MGLTPVIKMQREDGILFHCNRSPPESNVRRGFTMTFNRVLSQCSRFQHFGPIPGRESDSLALRH